MSQTQKIASLTRIALKTSRIGSGQVILELTEFDSGNMSRTRGFFLSLRFFEPHAQAKFLGLIFTGKKIILIVVGVSAD